MRRIAGLGLFLLVTVVGCGPGGPPVGANLDPKVTGDELAAMSGRWAYERQVVEGKEITDMKGSIVISGGSMTRHVVRADGQALTPIMSKLFVDPTTEPRQMDDQTSVMFRTNRRLGIYKLDGDKLTLCYDNTGKQRPTAFESPPGTSFVLTVLRRQGK